MVKIISVRATFDGSRRAIEDFAFSFHQDFALLEKHPNEYAQKIFKSLSKEQKASLRESFIKLLEENPGKNQKNLKKAWHSLGADWWDKKLDLRATIQNWINYL